MDEKNNGNNHVIPQEDQGEIPNQVQPQNTIGQASVPDPIIPIQASAPDVIQANPVVAQAVPPKKSHKSVIIIILLILLLFGGILASAAYFKSKLQLNNTPKPVAQTAIPVNKPLLIGSDTTYPPMESPDKSGNFIGYDIDLGNLIAKSLGREAQFKSIKFDDIFTELDQKKYDIIISAITITDDRKKKYDFSDQYINAGEVIVATKVSAKDNQALLKVTDLQGKKIGVEQGTTEVANAEKFTKPSLVIQYPSNDPALADLKSGKIDGVLTDLPNAKGITTVDPDLRIASDPLTDEYYGIVFRKGDALVSKINEILASLRANGVLTDLKQKWLN